MPTNLDVAAFVFGSILTLIALLGSGFKIFGAEIISKVTAGQRVASGCGAILLFSVAGLIYFWSTPKAPGQLEQTSGAPVTSGPVDDNPRTETSREPHRDTADEASDGVGLDDSSAPPPKAIAKIKHGSEGQPKRGLKVLAGTQHGDDGYSFVFDRCLRAGSRVTCHFQVTNEKEDRNLTIIAGNRRGPSILFDDLGNEYWAKQAVLGTNRSASDTIKTMITGIAIPASLVFEGVTDEATHISVLQVGCQGHSRLFSFKIRNIEFTK